MPVKSADWVLDILELLAAAGRALTHADIARRTGIPKSSLTQLLRNLVRRGYVQVDNNRFRLGDGAIALVRRGLRAEGFVGIVQPHLDRLTAQTGESSSLSLRFEDISERVCSAESARAVLYALHVGDQAPLYSNAAGKVFLAWMTPQEREAYLRAASLEPLTTATVRSAAALRRQLQAVREEGIAYSMGEFTTGIVGIAAPVFDVHGRVVASISIALPATRFDDAKKQQLAAALRQRARRVSREISALPPGALLLK